MSGNHPPIATASLRANLESPDLTTLLCHMDDTDIDRLASILIEMPKGDVLNSCVTGIGRGVFGLSGKALIPGIVRDLSWLASPTVGSSKTYRDTLQAVARRHGIEDNGLALPSEIERALQAQYVSQLRPDPRQFTERTAPHMLAKLSERVAAAAFPSSRIVTAAVLEIAALRRIALMRDFAKSLEPAA